MADAQPTPVSTSQEIELTAKWQHHAKDVDTLILESDAFIVYLKKPRQEVEWESTPVHDAWLKKKGLDKTECQSRISYLESLPCDHLKHELRRSFRCQLGEAMVATLRGKAATAAKILDRARQFLTARNQEYARRNYILWTGVMALAMCILTSLAVLAHFHWAWHWDAWLLADACVGGSLGSFLFASARMDKANIDPDAETSSHQTEACARVVLGTIGALIAYCSVKGDFLLPHLVTNNYGLFVICLLGSASERFATGIVDRFDNWVAKPSGPAVSMSSKRSSRKRDSTSNLASSITRNLSEPADTAR